MTTPAEDALRAMLQPGKALRVFFREGNVNNETRHIRAVVDGDQIVYRVWSKKKRAWRYFVEWDYAFLLLLEDGYLSEVRR